MVRIPDGYVLCDDGQVRLERHDNCGQGHPVTRVGWGSCPACRRLTMLWHCDHLRCAGTVTATAHQQACGGHQ